MQGNFKFYIWCAQCDIHNCTCIAHFLHLASKFAEANCVQYCGLLFGHLFSFPYFCFRMIWHWTFLWEINENSSFLTCVAILRNSSTNAKAMNVSECTDNDPKCKMQAHNVNKGEEGGKGGGMLNGKCAELTMANLGSSAGRRAINGSCIFTGPCSKNKEAAAISCKSSSKI